MSLTPKQQRFVQEYLVDLNATQAAIRAGYSEKTAEVIGYQLLRKTLVSEAIAVAQAKTADKLEITKERWLREMACIGFLDPMDVFENDGSIKQIKDIPESARRAMADFTVTEIFDNAADDQKHALGLLKKIKFHSKPETLRDLGKALGFLRDGGDINVTMRFAYGEEAKQ